MKIVNAYLEQKRIKTATVLWLLAGVILGLAGMQWIFDLSAREMWMLGLIGFYLLLTVQAGWFLYWITYAWNDPEEIDSRKSPSEFVDPKLSFTALLPARHEEAVIGDTIRAIAGIRYPEEMKELLVLIRADDVGTIRAAEEAISELHSDIWNTGDTEYGDVIRIGVPNVRVVVVDDLPVNKPNQLNWGLREATKDVVVIFDAEDQPHTDIYNIANTVMLREGADVLQSGVQLMNYQSRWFSALNVLEYYFWFKSAMHYFAKKGVVLLGGNTVFFKRKWLNVVNGWDEQCLTEDGDIGIRMSLLGAKIAVVYDEQHTTQEETPPTVAAFVKQRTRWNQGFLQILAKGDWLKFGSWQKSFLAGYLLILPILVMVLIMMAPVAAWLAIWMQMPMGVTMVSFVPLGMLAIYLIVAMVGIAQFASDYQLGRPWKSIALLSLVFIPYMGLLAMGAVRAIWRYGVGNLSWEKTEHVNAHRMQ